MPIDPTTLAQLDGLAATLAACADPRRASAEWKQVYRLLQKTDAPAGEVTGVVGMRQVPNLTALLDQLRNPSDAPPPPEPDAPDAETCKRAMRAFRKRLKFTRLDDESRITSHNPLSKGKDVTVSAGITPPNEWPEAVWKELVRQGKLNAIGQGIYELTGD